MMNLVELEKNGTFELDNRNYVLAEQAYLTGTIEDPHYEAHAYCCEDELDEYGDQPVYLVRFDLLEEFDPENTDEESACDWDEPSSVVELPRDLPPSRNGEVEL